jgi:hypothetical protein
MAPCIYIRTDKNQLEKMVQAKLWASQGMTVEEVDGNNKKY